jgi:hypothetical protein
MMHELQRRLFHQPVVGLALRLYLLEEVQLVDVLKQVKAMRGQARLR